MTKTQAEIRAEMRLLTEALFKDIPFFKGVSGMRMVKIYPADSPHPTAVFGHGRHLWSEQGASAPACSIRVLTDAPEGFEWLDVGRAEDVTMMMEG